VVGDDWRDSQPWWPPEPRPPEGAPNIVLVVLDDVGFGQLGCYGSDLDTPTIDGLAAAGVRMANFHTTALCSPTRACLLTGRNHHSNGMGRVADLAMGYPGYWGRIPVENGFVSEMLRARGYATYAVGKWHLTPDDESWLGAPRDTWPLSRGFDRWYGFHGGETHQFVPSLYYDSHAVTPPAPPETGYHLSADLADRAREFVADLRAVDVDRPFFLYLCPGACHSPHHAPARWIERYRGRFDSGWDAWREATFERQQALGFFGPGTELSERPAWVPAWDSLDPADQAVAARFMECFAAYLSYTDAQLARVLEFLAETGDLDHTLVVVVSDNGASAEGGAGGSINDIRLMNVDPAGPEELRARIDELGGPTAHNNYPWGWTMAGNTPFRRWKREVHEGGVASPCVVWWPSGLGPGTGGLRHQFTHAVDLVPTLLELVGLDAPTELAHVPQTPLEGTSFAGLLVPGGATVPEAHHTQYFEMLGCRAVYHRGWKAVTYKPIGPLYDDGLDPDAPFAEDVWELYHVAEDPTETLDRAAAEPGRLAEMIECWWAEARRHQVLPLDNRVLHTILNPRPSGRPERARFVYYPGTAPVPEPVAVDVKNRGHRITVDVTVPPGPPVEGVLLALGTVLGGWSLHVVDGRLRYVHNLYGKERHVVTSETPLGPGAHRLGFVYQRRVGLAGHGTLSVDDEVVGEGEIARFTFTGFNGTGAGLTCGYEIGPAVGPGYRAPFAFTGTIDRAVVEVDGDARMDPVAIFEAIMSAE
jgi:arylsulfatase